MTTLTFPEVGSEPGLSQHSACSLSQTSQNPSRWAFLAREVGRGCQVAAAGARACVYLALPLLTWGRACRVSVPQVLLLQDGSDINSTCSQVSAPPGVSAWGSQVRAAAVTPL